MIEACGPNVVMESIESVALAAHPAPENEHETLLEIESDDDDDGVVLNGAMDPNDEKEA